MARKPPRRKVLTSISPRAALASARPRSAGRRPALAPPPSTSWNAPHHHPLEYRLPPYGRVALGPQLAIAVAVGHRSRRDRRQGAHSQRAVRGGSPSLASWAHRRQSPRTSSYWTDQVCAGCSRPSDPALEALHASTGVRELLSAGVERMTVGDLDVQLLASGARHELIATRAAHVCLHIARVYLRLHRGTHSSDGVPIAPEIAPMSVTAQLRRGGPIGRESEPSRGRRREGGGGVPVPAMCHSFALMSRPSAQPVESAPLAR